ncbi:MAG: PDZ domain-containing protein, partial [Actinobacteria bacterium]|nr:PDZ domain-containing protein [Actinomycetota bacterium]
RDGDWLFAEELVSRARGLLDGSGRADAYNKYDDALETDIGRRVRLVLAYAPRAWYELRKRQYDRLDDEDRKEPFAPFNEKGSDDWRQSIEGINRDILREALGKIAAQHLDHVGWKPLVEGGLGMLRVLAETPELAESFPGLADRDQARGFAEAVRAQSEAVAAMKPAEVDARVLDRCLDAVAASNAATVKLPEEVLVREFGEGAVGAVGNDFEDPYTEIVWPDRMRRFRQMIDGNFVGVGILIRHNEKRDIVVINPLDGSPAKRAGIKPGDRIVAVNGSSTAEWPLDKAVDTITGPAGTAVKLSVARDGAEGALDFPLIRERIKMYSVQGWRKAGYTDR